MDGIICRIAVIAAALLAAALLWGCKKAPEGGEQPAAKKPAAPATGALIADSEALGFNVRIGEKFSKDRLIAQLAKSRFKVDVAAQDATDRMVPGTVGDGTVYFWISADPRGQGAVGGLTIGVDLNTAEVTGKITRVQLQQLNKEARAAGGQRSGDAPNLAKYAAAEAELAAARNPGVVTDAGVGLGSTKDEVLRAYGETKDQIFISGDTVRVYRGPKVAVGFRFSDNVVRQILVFPADYDYVKFSEDTETMFEGKPVEPGAQNGGKANTG